MKKRRILIIFLIFILIGCSNQSSTTLSDNQRFKEEYESLNGKVNSVSKYYRTLEIPEENPFIYKTASDIQQMIEEKESFVVYFGFATCPWCRSILPSLIAVASDLGISEIYYVDVSEIRDTMKIDELGNIITETEGTDAYYQLLEKLNNVLEEYTLTNEDGEEVETGEKRIYAPSIISIINGEATEMTDGISLEQTDAYMELTPEMEQESYDKIKCAIQCVIDSKEVCSAKTKC